MGVVSKGAFAVPSGIGGKGEGNKARNGVKVKRYRFSQRSEKELSGKTFSLLKKWKEEG